MTEDFTPRAAETGVEGVRADSDDELGELDIYEALINPNLRKGTKSKSGGPGGGGMMPMMGMPGARGTAGAPQAGLAAGGLGTAGMGGAGMGVGGASGAGMGGMGLPMGGRGPLGGGLGGGMPGGFGGGLGTSAAGASDVAIDMDGDGVPDYFGGGIDTDGDGRFDWWPERGEPRPDGYVWKPGDDRWGDLERERLERERLREEQRRLRDEEERRQCEEAEELQRQRDEELRQLEERERLEREQRQRQREEQDRLDRERYERERAEREERERLQREERERLEEEQRQQREREQEEQRQRDLEEEERRQRELDERTRTNDPSDDSFTFPRPGDPRYGTDPAYPGGGDLGGGFPGGGDIGGTGVAVDPLDLEAVAKSWDELSAEMDALATLAGEQNLSDAGFGFIPVRTSNYANVKTGVTTLTAGASTEFTDIASNLGNQAKGYREQEEQFAADANAMTGDDA